MKKIKISVTCISIILTIVFIVTIKSYNESKVRPDIYNNSKLYQGLIVKAANSLKDNGAENKELDDKIGDFYDKYKSNKTSKKEKELLNGLLSETLDYERMVWYKKHGDTISFNKCFSNFEHVTCEINNCLK